jgi:hypothetical protein
MYRERPVSDPQPRPEAGTPTPKRPKRKGLAAAIARILAARRAAGQGRQKEEPSLEWMMRMMG